MSYHHNHKDLKGKRLEISILLNILITIAQLIGGLISGSLSLLSDALHNFSDVISLFVSYIANLLGKRKYTVEKTFGYKRVEIKNIHHVHLWQLNDKSIHFEAHVDFKKGHNSTRIK